MVLSPAFVIVTCRYLTNSGVKESRKDPKTSGNAFQSRADGTIYECTGKEFDIGRIDINKFLGMT